MSRMRHREAEGPVYLRSVRRMAVLVWMALTAATTARAQTTLDPQFIQGGQSFSYNQDFGFPVVWSISGAGLIDQSGTYTAPDTLTTDSTVTVTVTKADDNSVVATGVIHLTAPLTVSPQDATLGPGDTVKYQVSPSTVPVTFSIGSGPGTIDPDGTYHAPDVIDSDQFVNIQIQSTDGSGRGTGVNLTVKKGAPKPIRINPTTQVRLKAGESQQFTLDPPGTPAKWSKSGDGTIDENSGLYTAPAAIPQDETVTVTASTTDGTNRAASTDLLLVSGSSSTGTPFQIQPATATLHAGQSQQFSTGSVPAAWSVDVGTVDATGLYTAPAVLTTSVAATLVARSTDGTSRLSTATLYLIASPVTQLRILPASPVSLMAGQSVRFTVDPAVPVTWSKVSGDGSIALDGTFTAPAAIAQNSTTTLSAQAVGNPSLSATVSLSLIATPAPMRQILPPAPTLQAGQTVQFTVSPSVPVSWGTTLGTIDQNGLYTAPAHVASDATAIVLAFALDDSFSIQTTVRLLAGLQVSPASVTLGPGEAGTFTVTPNVPVSWSVIAGDGSITAGGVYTAPGVIAVAHAVTIRAQAGDGRTAEATVNLRSAAGVMWGDLTQDGRVNIADATLALRAATGIVTLTPDQARAADVNGDGKVGVGDATLILSYAVGLIIRFPVGG